MTPQEAAKRRIELQAEKDSLAMSALTQDQVTERRRDIRNELAALDELHGPMNFITTRVAGVSYRQDDVRWLAENATSTLMLIPDPSNEYDANAIKVVAVGHDGTEHHVGFIPKHSTHIVHAMFQSDALVYTHLVHVRQPKGRGWSPGGDNKPAVLGIKILCVYKPTDEVLKVIQ